MADHQNRFFHRKKIMTIFFVCAAVLCGLLGRLLYLMVWRAEYYEEAKAMYSQQDVQDDAEMQLLDEVYGQVEAGGWLD